MITLNTTYNHLLLERTVYHSTDKQSAQEIASGGINPQQLQRRDSGYFGPGFYASEKPNNFYGRSVVALSLHPNAKVLQAGETNPAAPPPWHGDFINSYRERVRKFRPNIDSGKLQGIVNTLTPGHPDFCHTSYRNAIQGYAKHRGFDAVSYGKHGGEFVITNPQAVRSAKHVGGIKAAQRYYDSQRG